MTRDDDLFEVQIDVASIQREIERLKRIQEIAKGAPARIKRWNELYALYGDEPAKPPPATNGSGGKSRAQSDGFGSCPIDDCEREFHGTFRRNNVRQHLIDRHPRLSNRRLEDAIAYVEEQMTGELA